MKRIAATDLAVILRGSAGLGSSRRAAETAAARVLVDSSAAAYQLAIEVFFATLTYGTDLGPYSPSGETCQGWVGDGRGTRTPTPGWQAARRAVELGAALLVEPDAWPSGPDPVQRAKDAYAWFQAATSKQSLNHDTPQPPLDEPYWRYWLMSLQCRGYLDDFGTTKKGRERGALEYLAALRRQAGTWRSQVRYYPIPGGVLPADPLSGPGSTWHPLIGTLAPKVIPLAAAGLAEVWWLKAVSWEVNSYPAPVPVGEYLEALERAHAAIGSASRGRRRRYLATQGDQMIPARRVGDARGQRRLGTAVAATGAALAWALQRLR